LCSRKRFKQSTKRDKAIVARRSSHERSYPTSGPVSTWMGDRLWAGIPSRYVTSQLGQLSIASLRDR